MSACIIRDDPSVVAVPPAEKTPRSFHDGGNRKIQHGDLMTRIFTNVRDDRCKSLVQPCSRFDELESPTEKPGKWRERHRGNSTATNGSRAGEEGMGGRAGGQEKKASRQVVLASGSCYPLFNNTKREYFRHRRATAKRVQSELRTEPIHGSNISHIPEPNLCFLSEIQNQCHVRKPIRSSQGRF